MLLWPVDGWAGEGETVWEVDAYLLKGDWERGHLSKDLKDWGDQRHVHLGGKTLRQREQCVQRYQGRRHHGSWVQSLLIWAARSTGYPWVSIHPFHKSLMIFIFLFSPPSPRPLSSSSSFIDETSDCQDNGKCQQCASSHLESVNEHLPSFQGRCNIYKT
jgi:hypothetical protein